MYCQMRKSTFLKFIDQWKREECLWNMKSPDYTDKQMKGMAYAKLLKTLEEDIDNATVDYVKKKIKSLRSTFNREKKKEETMKSEGKTDHASKIWYFNELSFLSDSRSSYLSDDDVDTEAEEESMLHRPIKSECNESEMQENEVSLTGKTENELQALDVTSKCTTTQLQLHVSEETCSSIAEEQNELQTQAAMSSCTNFLPQLHINRPSSATGQVQNQLQQHLSINSTTNQTQLVNEEINSPIQSTTENFDNGITTPQVNFSSQKGSDKCRKKRPASCDIEQSEQLHNFPKVTTKADEFDIMGQNIGCKMRKLSEKSQETAMMVECLIYQIIALGHRDQISEHTMIADTRRLINPYGSGTGPSSSMVYYMNRPPHNPSNSNISNNRPTYNPNFNTRPSQNSNFNNHLPHDPSIYNHLPPHNTANVTYYPTQSLSNFNNRPI